MASEDHFNWPSASRNDTMYLSTIRQQEQYTAKKKFFTDKSPNLDISDIDKARPYYQGYQFNQKETFANRNDDIAGSRPKKLHQPLEKEYFALKNEDIVGTKPKCQKFTTTRFPTNPLNPEYKLPHVEIRVSTPPKFIRDNIAINDIDGAKPNPYTRYNIQGKTNNVEDIDGAKPKKEWIPQGKQSSLNVKDINSFWEFHTKRQTNPLSPRYKVAGENNELIDYGKLDNKVIVRHPKEVNKVTSLDLKTDDIPGAQASTATQHVTKLETRDTFIKTKDIAGAQTGTLKKGMSTNRHLDPLWPVYKVPGHSEPVPVYTRNMVPINTVNNKQESHSAASKVGTTTDFASPVGDVVKSEDQTKLVGITRTKSGSSNGEGKDKTPTSGNAFARTGSEILNGGKRGSELAPVRLGSNENVDTGANTKPKSITNLENKKPMTANEIYQKSVKGFFGVSDDALNSKPLSKAEKFDKYITK